MEGAGSVHLSVHMTTRSGTVDYVVDAAAHVGRLLASISGVGHATFLQVGNTAYIRGNKLVLADFGFPAAAASQLRDRWVSVQPADTGYALVTQDVALPSVIDEAKLDAPLRLTGRSTVVGRKVEGVHGTVTAGLGAPADSTATIYISVKRRPVPVRYVGDSSALGTVATYSRWGEPVHFTAPPHAIPVTSISGESSS